MNLHSVALDPRRDCPRRQRDGVRIQRPPEVRFLRGPEDDHDRADGEAGRENDLRDVDVGDQNFLQQPGKEEEETACPINRNALVVSNVHAHGDVDHERAGSHAEADEQWGVVPGEQQPDGE